ncbi:CaiB/BaiF CoA transferase family protein [Paraburkholderia sediminicola]|uniref:CaiB/BaiF CoA transferase family protein n=1 Tax=Paraburkholderia sediminicola TaxID=458836 RepID=UPI0038BA1AF9
MNDASSNTALAGIRVLDLSTRFGFYTGKLFADMGADVVLVEQPGGCALRDEAPFLGNQAGTSLGIPFNYLNTSKRGISLDLTQTADLAVFRELAAVADLIIEDGPPGTLRRRGIDHEQLVARNAALVLTSITPFGQSGPYAQFAATDLTLLALGGFLNMMGYPDGPPTQAYGNQAVAIGCMFAAVGSMMAVLAAQVDGVGQRVDVAIHECVTMAIENAAQFYDLAGVVRKRFAGEMRHAGTGVFECCDGYVYLFAGGMGAARFWNNLVRWLQEEDVAGSQVLSEPRWTDSRFMDSGEAKSIFDEIFPSFCARWRKEDLYHESQRRNVPLCPINDVEDVLNNAQMRHRGLFVGVPHERFGEEILMPGVPFHLSASPGRIAHRAPELGEHNDLVLAEWGVRHTRSRSVVEGRGA